MSKIKIWHNRQWTFKISNLHMRLLCNASCTNHVHNQLSLLSGTHTEVVFSVCPSYINSLEIPLMYLIAYYFYAVQSQLPQTWIHMTTPTLQTQTKVYFAQFLTSCCSVSYRIVELRQFSLLGLSKIHFI